MEPLSHPTLTHYFYHLSVSSKLFSQELFSLKSRWALLCEHVRQRALDPLELELKVVGSHMVWVLGTELLSSKKTKGYHSSLSSLT